MAIKMNIHRDLSWFTNYAYMRSCTPCVSLYHYYYYILHAWIVIERATAADAEHGNAGAIIINK